MKIILYFTVIVIIKNTDIFRKYLNDNKKISMRGKSDFTPWGYIFNCDAYLLLGYRLLTELFKFLFNTGIFTYSSIFKYSSKYNKLKHNYISFQNEVNNVHKNRSIDI